MRKKRNIKWDKKYTKSDRTFADNLRELKWDLRKNMRTKRFGKKFFLEMDNFFSIESAFRHYFTLEVRIIKEEMTGICLEFE